MISKKVLYSEQLLQLVLALSLLQVDPVNYLNLEWGFSRIHSNDGSPWQLEVTHRPFSVYPYMGRKHYTPLIEDLVRFEGYNDVQAYLLNLSDEPTPASLLRSNSNSFNVTANNSVDIELSQGINSSSTSNLNLIQDFPSSNFDEIFFHSDAEQLETVSISEQNLADLNDYDHQHKEIKNYSLDPWEDLSSPTRNFERRHAGSSFNSDASNWEALSWITISSFSNDDLPSEQNERHGLENETKGKNDSTKIKSDDVDELSNVSSVELTLEVSRARKIKLLETNKYLKLYLFVSKSLILRKNLHAHRALSSSREENIHTNSQFFTCEVHILYEVIFINRRKCDAAHKHTTAFNKQTSFVHQM